MKIPTWMVERLQEAGDPGVAAYAKWLHGELLAPEEAELLFDVESADVRRNAGMLDAFASGGEIKPGTFYVCGEHVQPCAWGSPTFSWEFIENLNKRLAGKKIRRVEQTECGNINFITDDAEGDAFDSTVVQHHCGGEDKDYEHWRPMRPGERCSYCGWEYPLRVDVTTMSDDHRMRLNLNTGLIEKGESLTEEWSKTEKMLD